MTILDIVKYPDPFLRLKAKQVTVFDKDFQTLVNNMFETMREAPGVGLAAPQIHQSLRVVVIEYGDEEDENLPPRKYVLVNPHIVARSEEMESEVEGCLSVPGLAGVVERSLAVKVKAQNRFGKPITLKAEGWLARIIQHEMDHLDGVLYIDRATEVYEPSAEEAAEIRD